MNYAQTITKRPHMKIQNRFILTAAILPPLIHGDSQEAGAPGQGEPIPAAVQPVDIRVHPC